MEDRHRGGEEEKKRRRSLRKLKENLPNGEGGEGGLERADTYTKKERRQAAARLSLHREEGRGRANSHSREIFKHSKESFQEVPRMTTSFKEVADRKLRQETSPVLSRSGPNSPMSWYICLPSNSISTGTNW